MKLLLLLFKGASLSKLLFSGGTMVLSVAVYASVFGWPYALGFVVLLFFHEAGHFLAARQRGLSAGLPMFIPFVGAWITLEDRFPDAETEAWVGIAGPLFGSLAAVACYFLAQHFSSSLLLALAYSGFMLNLFNLIPVPPLDGGRVTVAISRKIWLIGIPFLLGFFWLRPSPMLLLVCFLAGMQFWARRSEINEHGAAISAAKRVEYTLLYFGLIAWLSLMSWNLHHQLAAFR